MNAVPRDVLPSALSRLAVRRSLTDNDGEAACRTMIALPHDELPSVLAGPAASRAMVMAV